MKRNILTMLISILSIGITNAQNYVQLTDASGTKVSGSQLTILENAAQDAIDVLPAADAALFKIYDAGFYVHTESTIEGVTPIWDKIKADIENDPNSEYYLIFGRESNSQGLNRRIRVELKLPTTSAYDCLTEEERVNLGLYIEQAANDNLDFQYLNAEVIALEFLKDYFHKIIVCNCSNSGAGCSQFTNFNFLDIQLRGLDFRRKEIKIGDASTWASGTQDIYDYAGKKIFIDGFEYDIADQISEGKALLEAATQILPDTTISTNISGKVFILDNESFTNGEWESAKAEALLNDYVEYWVVLTNPSGKSYLYSRFTLGDLAPVAAKGSNNTANKPVLGIIPTWGDALKALGNAAVDATMQALISYLIDDSVNDWSDAWGKVSYLGAAWEGISSLIPWKKKLNGPQAFVVKAAAGAFAVTLDNYYKDKENYTVNQALIDFGVGFGASAITQLVLHPRVVNAIGRNTRGARLKFAKGVRKLNYNSVSFLNRISRNAFKSLRGTINKRLLDEIGDAALVSRVKELRGKLLSGQKRSLNFGHASIEGIPELSKREFFAHSKVQSLNPTLRERVPKISTLPQSSIFPYDAVPNSRGVLIDRNVDAEFKILSEIADRLGNNINTTGKIKLFTEIDACTSCANVIGMFSAIYKNIEIELIHNSANPLKP